MTDKTYQSYMSYPRVMRTLFLILMLQTCSLALSEAEPAKIIGSWKVEITFPNGETRSLRFDAQDAGKGALQLADPQSNTWGTAKPAEAKWTLSDRNTVFFSGAVEFPLGNVGRDPGKLVCNGKFESENLITGEAEFSPSIGDRPTKSGTFRAIRAPGGKGDQK
jgi:hypothetical protein